MALSYNQDLKAAMHKVTAYEALHRSAKSDLYPKISASGDATYTGNPREFTFTKSETPWTIRGKHSQYGIGVNIEQPLYQGGGLRAQVRKSAAEQDVYRPVKPELLYLNEKQVYEITLAGFKQFVRTFIACSTGTPCTGGSKKRHIMD